MSILEMVVVLAIGSLLLAVMLPAISNVRATSRRVQCVNHLHNIALGLVQFDQTHRRLPPSGSYGFQGQPQAVRLHSWAVSLLPYIEQTNLFRQLDLDLPADDPVNTQWFASAHIPLYACPMDISLSSDDRGNLSYAVNGGTGFTVKYHNGVRDCPVDREWTRLDLDGDGQSCTGTEPDDRDKRYFHALGLFFLETRDSDISVRHHSLGDIIDGATQTFLVTENVRAGVDPTDPHAHFADADPYRCAVYIGNPCAGGRCGPGQVDYGRSNSGINRINSGLWSPEGSSPVPNSFHAGGVNMAWADGRVALLSEGIDGGVYAAMASPQGRLLDGTPLEQPLPPGAAR